MGSYQRVISTQCDETYILFPRDKSPPAICSDSTYKCFGVPLQNVAVTQSVPNTFLEALGVLDKISVASEYTTSACIAKRVADGAAEAFVSHSSDETAHAEQMGDPALDAIFSDPWYTSSWHHAPSAGKVTTYPAPSPPRATQHLPPFPLYPAPSPPPALHGSSLATHPVSDDPPPTYSGTLAPHRSSARPPRTSSRRSDPPSGSSSSVRPPAQPGATLQPGHRSPAAASHPPPPSSTSAPKSLPPSSPVPPLAARSHRPLPRRRRRPLPRRRH